MKNKTIEIIKFSFFNQFKNKWFIIFNVISLLTVIVSVNYKIIAEKINYTPQEETFIVEVVDNSDLAYSKVFELFKDEEKFEISKISENTYDEENIDEDMLVVEVIPDDLEGFKLIVTSKDAIAVDVYNSVIDKFEDIHDDFLRRKYNLSSESFETIINGLDITRQLLSVDVEDYEQKYIIKFVVCLLTYLITSLLFNKIANEVFQEKQSKSSEYILTAVTSKQYLLGKAISNTIILIMQFCLFIMYWLIANNINILLSGETIEISSNIDFSTLDISSIIGLVLWTLLLNALTVFLISIIQATIASKTNSTAEANSSTLAITTIMIIGFYVSVFAVNQETIASIPLYIASVIPGLSCYFIPAMMAVGQDTPLQIILALYLLISAIPATFNICAPMFKDGILDYTRVIKKSSDNDTKKATNKEIFDIKKLKNIGFCVGIATIAVVIIENLITIVTASIVPSITSLGIFSELVNKEEINSILNYLNLIFAQVIAFLAGYYLIKAYVEKPTKVFQKKSDIPFKKSVKIVAIGTFLVFLVQILVQFLYPAIGINYNPTELDVTTYSSPLLKIIMFIAIAICPALMEELFFRKGLVDLTKPASIKFALIFSAFMFALFHMNISQGIATFIMGIIFAGIYIYTKDIRHTMALHLINNGFAGVIAFSIEEGNRNRTY